MFWKKTSLVCIVVTALGVAGYGQTTRPLRGRSTGLQASSGYLGVGVVGVRDLPAGMAKSLNLRDNAGVLVTRVVAGEAGEKAGIHQQDVILEFNGQKVDSDTELTSLIVSKSPGTKVNLTVSRNSVKQNIVATLGTRPLDLPLTSNGMGPVPEGMTPEQIRGMISAAGAVPSLNVGFYCVEMMPQLAAFFGVQEGLLVESVDGGSPAARAGLKAGDVITKVNGMPVTTAREVSGIIRLSGKKIVGFTVFRNKKEMNLNVEMAWLRPDAAQRDSVN